MITAVFVLSVFIISINGDNAYEPQRRYNGNAENFGRTTRSPIIRILSNREEESSYIQNDYSKNVRNYDNFNSNFQNHDLRDRDESSSQQPGNSRGSVDRNSRDSPVNSSSKNGQTRTNVTNRQNAKNQGHSMIFPSSEEDVSAVFGKPRQPQTPFVKPLNRQSGPRNCTFNLCDEVDDYPTEKILKIISRSRELQGFFTPYVDLDNRFGEDGDTLCPTMMHTQFPKSAMNTNKEEKLLVNVGDYKQGIVFETCVNEDKPCEYADNFPDNIVTVCKQRYTVRRLMTVSADSDKTVFDNFHLPSCCVCFTKKN